MEEKQRQLEERGVAVEKALRGEAGIVWVSFGRRFVPEGKPLPPPPHSRLVLCHLMWNSAAFPAGFSGALHHRDWRFLLSKGKGKHLCLGLPQGLHLFFTLSEGLPFICRTNSQSTSRVIGKHWASSSLLPPFSLPTPFVSSRKK